MLIKLLISFSLLVSYELLLPKKVYAKCDFKTSNYIKELDSPDSIRKINIKRNLKLK